MKYILSLFLSIAFALQVTANDAVKQQADSAYAAERYTSALKLYERLEPSAAVYYNMGNCYYRMDSLAHAILFYERAQLFSPGNADIQFNLTMARGKTVDKLVPRHEFFFVGWYRTLCHMFSVDIWAIVAIAAFAFALLGFLIYVFLPLGRMRTAGMVVGIVLTLVCALSNVFAWSQRRALEHRTGAVVMTNNGTVRSTPSLSGKALFVLHEGTHVEITDDSLNGWFEVELADGKKGWIQAPDIERI